MHVDFSFLFPVAPTYQMWTIEYTLHWNQRLKRLKGVCTYIPTHIELFTTQGCIKNTNIEEMAIQNPDSLVFNIKIGISMCETDLQKPNPM